MIENVFSILYWDHTLDDHRGGYDQYSGSGEFGIWLSEDACQAAVDKLNRAKVEGKRNESAANYRLAHAKWTERRLEWNALRDAGLRHGEYTVPAPVPQASVKGSRYAKQVDGVWLDDYYEVESYAVNDGENA